MVSIKCGKCGMVHNLTEDHIVGRGSGFYCPNCDEQYPAPVQGALYEYACRFPSFGDWKVYVLPSPEELRKLQL